MSSIFNILMEELTNLVNTSQYFNPFFSWMVVSYTYFSIGLHGVSLIFIGMSIISFFPKDRKTVVFIRILLWRIKGNLGIVFLVDLLLLRIDLDKNKLLEQTRQLKLNNIKNVFNGMDLNPSGSSVSPPITQNINMNIEYTNKLLSKNKSDDFRKSYSQNKENSNDVQTFVNPYLMENNDVSKNNNFNYSTNYSRNKRKNSRVSNISSNFRINTSPVLPHSNFSYDKPSDSSTYKASLHKVTYSANSAGIETTSVSTSPYDSMSRLNSGAISIENMNPSSLSSINESLSRSFSQKTPVETYQDSFPIPHSYQRSLNYSFPENEPNDQIESMKNRHLGNMGMDNPIYQT
ncbi:hypothetical protein PIROE2DRAFT_64409 [Piromyces sp. E2]|nr:hypothetical protein PIROE2DRAFT_64409 [Piromyces sp. E2]|eukprot:OUM58449.1 hypothetical protein PIROE2DRAFT_64409 [Piromyces sp. E2]